MNILKPELIWVDGRCYRSLDNNEYSNRRAISPYVEDSCHVDFDDSEECYDDNIEIVPHKGTKFKHIYHVAKPYFRFIAGPKHAVRKRLEMETGTVIQIPNVGQDGDILIIGSDQRSIKRAYRKINLLIEGAKKKLPPTHFLSVPLNEGHIIMQFNMFKNEVLTNSGKSSEGVNEILLQIPSKLHLTIGMLTLLNDTDRNQAIEALNYCKEHIIRPAIDKYGQIPIRLQGIDIMNDDPSKAKVLYAKVVDKCEALQEIVVGMVNYYKNIGLLSEKYYSPKLHVTLMNIGFQFASERTINVVKASKTVSTFDATEIIKAHENIFFGETTLKHIHLSQRHTISSTGYYQATAKINLLEDL